MFARNWDAKTVLAAMFLVGYFALILFLPGRLAELDEEARQLVGSLIDPLGPVIGIIAFAIWRNSRRDNLEAEANANAVRSQAETTRLLVHKTPPVTGPADHHDEPAPSRQPVDPWEPRA